MWKTVKLGDICDISIGKTPSRGDKRYWDKEKQTENVWLSIADLTSVSGRHISDSKEYVSDEGAKLFKPVPKDTLVMSFKLSIGKLAFTQRELRTNEAIAALPIKDESLVTKEFLYHYLSSLDWGVIAGNDEKVKGKTLNKKKLNVLEVILPPLAEQQRVVAKLDAAFAEIDEVVKTNLEQARNAKSLFESSRATFLSAKSEDWAEKSLGDCCSRVSVGHVGSTSEYYCAEELGIPFLRSQNVKPERLELDGVRFITKAFHEKLKKSQLKANDILIVRVGANRGDCCLVPTNVEKLNCANIVFARPVEGHPSFLAHFCQSTIGRQRLMGMTTGAAQGVINTKSVATLRIPFPPLEQQRTIARKLDEINERAIELEAIYRERAYQARLLKSAILAQELQPQQSEAA